MKRSIIVGIIALLIVQGFSVIPLDEPTPTYRGMTDEATKFTKFETAADGDISNQSITQFSETLPDDVMLFPDQNISTWFDDANAEYTHQGSISGDYTDTFVNDGVYHYVANIGGSSIEYTFVLPSSVATLHKPLQVRWNGKIGGSSSNPHEAKISIWDWSTSSYDTLQGWTVVTKNTEFTWTDDISTDSNWYTTDVDGNITLRIRVDGRNNDVSWNCITYVDELAVEYYRPGSFDEDFTDISDWIAYQTEDPGDTITTDGDVLNITGEYKGTSTDYDYYYTNAVSISDASSYYIEYRAYKPKFAGVNGPYICFFSADDLSGSYGKAVMPISGSEYTTYRYILSDFGVTGEIESFYITAYTNTAGEEWEMNFDYIRIFQSNESGWAHDGSTTESIGLGAYASISSDGDVLTFTETANAQAFDFWIDYTSTNAKISTSDYQFLEFKIDSTTSGDGDTRTYLPRVYEDTSTYVNIFDYVNDTGVFRFNLKAAGLSYVRNIRFYLEDASDSFTLDYIKIYSIAGFKVTESSTTTNDVIHVDNGILKSSIDSGFFVLNREPSTQFDSSVYNVVNVTASQYSSLDYVKITYSDGLLSAPIYFTRGTTFTAGKGPNTLDFYFTLRDNSSISAIEFWSDSTPPSVQEKYSNPRDPTTADNVTIEVQSNDIVGLYTCTARILEQPDSSSLSDISLALEYTGSSGLELWSYTIGSNSLSAGRYLFEIDAFDGANHDYAFLSFTVTEDYRLTRIRIRSNLIGVDQYIPFEQFDVYLNGSLLLDNIFEADTSKAYNITVKDRWANTLNSTVFAWSADIVIDVPVYSLKVVSWYEDFVYFNLTRGGTEYSEVITPLDTVPFLLFQGNYTWETDYRNGSVISGSLSLTRSDAIVITGNTIADLASLSTSILNMTTTINVTVTTTQNQVISISIDLTNVNTTVHNQLIQILLNITNSNSTIYSQGLQILSTISNTNATLYNQTVAIISMITNVNSTLYDAIIDVSNDLILINSTLSAQYLSISSTLLSIDSSLASNFTNIIANLTAIGTNITSNHLIVASLLAVIQSNITTNYLSLTATLHAIDSSITAEVVELAVMVGNIPLFRGVTTEELAAMLGIELVDIDGDGVVDGPRENLSEKNRASTQELVDSMVAFSALFLIIMLLSFVVILSVIRRTLDSLVRRVTDIILKKIGFKVN